MCIFCERAKASLDDPFAGLDVGGGGDWSYSDGSTPNTSDKAGATSRAKAWAANLSQKREAEHCEELRRQARLPVTVITGFLGAGKTTFVNHILSARHGRRLAVIENEFGEVAVDDALLGNGAFERGDEAQQVILMPNGCMCCRVRGDLVKALKRLIVSASGSDGRDQGGSEPSSKGSADEAADGRKATQVVSKAESAATSAASIAVDLGAGEVGLENINQGRKPLDGIVLECSGLDELAPVLQTFFADSFVQEHVRLDAVVCLCDSPRLLRTLVGLSPTQSAMGLSSQTAPDTDEPKADERRDSAIGDGEEGEGDIEAMTGKLEESRKEISDPASALVLSQLALSDRVLLNKADLVTPEEGDALVTAVKEHFPGASVTRCERGQVDVDLVLGVDSFSLDKALEMDDQFADMLADGPSGEWGDRHRKNGQTREDRSKKIGNGHRKHEHARLGAQSVGIELSEAPIDWHKFTSWLKSFLEKEGEELIWRLKGVLWTTSPGRASSGTAATTWGWGTGKRRVVQGLYGHIESDESDWPAGATRQSRMVFIGDLSPRIRDALRAGVRSCIAAPRARPRPPPPPIVHPQRSTPSVGLGGGAFASRLGSVKFGGGGDDDMFL